MESNDLARGRALVGALPSGEWGIHNRGAGPGGGYAVERGIITPEAVALVLDADTARFIAWARNAMPSLLDAAERAARYEEVLWDIAYAEPASWVHASLKSYVYRTQGKARVALVRGQQPKGVGDE